MQASPPQAPDRWAESLPPDPAEASTELQRLRADEARVWGDHSQQNEPDDSTEGAYGRRTVKLPAQFEDLCKGIPSHTVDYVPASCAGKFATSWAEALEGSLDDDPE